MTLILLLIVLLLCAYLYALRRNLEVKYVLRDAFAAVWRWLVKLKDG